MKVSYMSYGHYGHTFKFLHPLKKTWCVLKITSDVNEFNNSRLLSGKNIKGVVNFYECYPIEGVITRKKGDELFAIVMELLTPLKKKDISNIKKVISWYNKNYEENSSVVKHFMNGGLSRKDWNVIYDMNLNQNPFSFLMRRINSIKDSIPDSIFNEQYTKAEFFKLMNFVITTQKRLNRHKIPGADIHIENIGIKNGEYKLFDLGVDSKVEHIDIDKIEIR
jgi:predicted transcriptional regulator